MLEHNLKHIELSLPHLASWRWAGRRWEPG
jgi:hypothetical protein